MRLTVLLRVSFPKKRYTPGLVYSGKNQKTKPLKMSYKMAAVNDIMREEQNMNYLKNPYLSAEEETVYGRAHPSKEQRFADFLKSKKRPFFPDRTLEEHYRNTAYTLKKWE